MASHKPLTDFEQDFLARTKLARETTGLSQERMARALGMEQGRYKHYEGRTLLPHEYICQFCAITRRSEVWLLTGRNPKGMRKDEATNGHDAPRPLQRPFRRD